MKEGQCNESALQKKRERYRYLEAQLLRLQRLETQELMIAGMVHDLANTLTPIRMFLQSIRSEIRDKKILAWADSVDACVNYSAATLKLIQSFASGGEVVMTKVHPQILLEDFAIVVRQSLPKSIALKLTVPRNIWAIEGDETQLFQLMMNLCVNARDAMPDGGTLCLSVENWMLDESEAALVPEARPGAYVVFLVSDTGMGIPKEIRSQVFEPFFTTKPTGKGMGLGLTSVLATVRSHHGCIEIQNQAEGGTLFKIYFPAFEAAKVSEKVLSPTQTIWDCLS